MMLGVNMMVIYVSSTLGVMMGVVLGVFDV